MEKILTIVIPTYNMEAYLQKCLNSLLIEDNNLMDYLEIIVVNDGSKDRSLTIMQEFEKAYPNTFVIIDKPNGGHGSACNLGVQTARGKYIRFLDSDDWMDKKNFQLYLRRLINETADVVETPMVYEYTSCYKSVVVKKKNINYDTIYDINDIDNYKTKDRKQYCVFSIHENTFLTAVLRKYVKFRENAVYDDNILGLIGVFGLKKMAFYDLPLYHYLNGREGQTMDPNVMAKKFRCIYYQVEDFINTYDKYNINLSSKAKNYALSMITHFIDNYYTKAICFFNRKEYEKEFLMLDACINKSINSELFKNIPILKKYNSNTFKTFYFNQILSIMPFKRYKQLRSSIGMPIKYLRYKITKKTKSIILYV